MRHAFSQWYYEEVRKGNGRGKGRGGGKPTATGLRADDAGLTVANIDDAHADMRTFISGANKGKGKAKRAITRNMPNKRAPKGKGKNINKTKSNGKCNN